MTDTSRNPVFFGLGESCHGVEDFHQMRFEIMESIINNIGPKSLDIFYEIDYLDGFIINEYINSDKSLKMWRYLYWHTNNIKFIELIKYLKDLRMSGIEVNFYGIDMQNSHKYISYIMDNYSEQLSLETSELLAELDLIDINHSSKILLKVEEVKYAIERDISENLYVNNIILNLLDKKIHHSYFSNVSFYQPQQGFFLREQFMFGELTRKIGSDLSFLLAHNIHISKSKPLNYFDEDLKTLGELINIRFNNYYCIALDMYKGVIEGFYSEKDYDNKIISRMNVEEYEDLLENHLNITLRHFGTIVRKEIMSKYITVYSKSAFDLLIKLDNIKPAIRLISWELSR